MYLAQISHVLRRADPTEDTFDDDAKLAAGTRRCGLRMHQPGGRLFVRRKKSSDGGAA
jgi:hypothetical protein